MFSSIIRNVPGFRVCYLNEVLMKFGLYYYEGHLKSSWTHIILSRNFVEVRWRSLFRSTSLGKRCTLTTLHPLLENVLQTVDHFEIPCLGAPFSWFEKPRNHMWRNLDCMAAVLVGFHRWSFSKMNTEFNAYLGPMRFVGFSKHEKGAPRQEISKRSTVCTKFSRSGLSVLRNASLAKGGTSKERPSPHLHKVPIRINNVSPRTLQTALVYSSWM
jgi:hypothetical protein